MSRQSGVLRLPPNYHRSENQLRSVRVFGNVDNLICFRIGSSDAEALSEELAGRVRPQDLINLPRYTAYVRMAIDGMPKAPFSMTTLAPKEGIGGDRSAVVRRTSNHRYARPASVVMREVEAAYAA